MPPAAEFETRLVLKQCITARAALAELKQVAELIPNQAMLVNTLPLLEARTSSEIEISSQPRTSCSSTCVARNK
ncbi:MAG: Fic/DOC family N-terminal domain-containing protein [Burkholderiales bacterium]